MFDGFTERELPAGRGIVFARVGGSGPPLLLLHGYPQTHLMWHTAAPLLVDRYTVVAADLPGYGASFRPVPTPDHAAHAKRAIALDLVQAMSQLGHNTFAVAGHDRGGRRHEPTRHRSARRRTQPPRSPDRDGRGPSGPLRPDGSRVLALGVPRPTRAAA
jgi:alpha/beta hydrolase fold